MNEASNEQWWRRVTKIYVWLTIIHIGIYLPGGLLTNWTGFLHFWTSPTILREFGQWRDPSNWIFFTLGMIQTGTLLLLLYKWAREIDLWRLTIIDATKWYLLATLLQGLLYLALYNRFEPRPWSEIFVPDFKFIYIYFVFYLGPHKNLVNSVYFVLALTQITSVVAFLFVLVLRFLGTKEPTNMQSPIVQRWPPVVTPIFMVVLVTLTCLLVTRLIFPDLNPMDFRVSPLVIAEKVAVVLCILGLLYGYLFSAKAQLRMSDYFKVSALADDHELTTRVHSLANKLSLPPPTVGLTAAHNAYAIGQSRKNASVVLGLPLVQSLTKEELDAVIGHELGHILSGDMRQMQYAVGFQTMFGHIFTAIATIGSTLVVAALSKSRRDAHVYGSIGSALHLVGSNVIFFASDLAVKGLSRQREFAADAIGAALTSPEAMMGALRKVHGETSPVDEDKTDYSYFMFRSKSLGELFATHPPLSARLEALAKLSGDKKQSFSLSQSDVSAKTKEPVVPEPTPAVQATFRAGNLFSGFKWDIGSRSSIAALLLALTAGVGFLVFKGITTPTPTSLTEWENRIEAAEKQVSSRESAVKAAENSLQDKEKISAEREFSAKAQLDEANALSSSVAQRQQELIKEKADFEAYKANAPDAVKQLQKEAAELETKQAALLESLKSLDASRAELDKTRASLDERELQVQAKESALKSSLEDFEKMNASIDPALSEKKKELQETGSKLMATQADLVIANRKLEEAQQALDGTSGTLLEKEQAVAQRESSLAEKERLFDERKLALEREWETVISAVPENVFGAVTVDSRGGWWGVANYASIKSAREAASRRCAAESAAGGCQTVELIRNCMALARAPNGAWSVEIRETRRAAGEAAVSACNERSQGQKCTVTKNDAYCSPAG